MSKNWLGRKTVQREIEGEMVTFYRLPVGTLRKFKAIAGCLGKSMSVFFDSRERDSRQERVQVPSEFRDEQGPIYQVKVTTDAVDPRIAEMRHKQVEEGIEGLVEVLTGEDTMNVMCEIIGRSARDEFIDFKDDYSKLQEEIPPNLFIQFLSGAWEASAGDFAELGKSLFLRNPKVLEVIEKMKTSTSPKMTSGNSSTMPEQSVSDSESVQ